MKALLLRGLAYILLVTGIWVVLMVEVTLLDQHRMFSELGVVELSQGLLLIMSIALFVRFGKTRSQFRELAWCLALTLGVLLVRETDGVLEIWLKHGFWKFPAGLLVIGLGAYFYRNRVAVIDQLGLFTHTLPFGLLLGFLSTLLFSRWFGKRVVWESLMGDQFDYRVKAAVEEGIELFAMSLLLAAALESLRLPVQNADQDTQPTI